MFVESHSNDTFDTLFRQYIHGPGIDEPLAFLEGERDYMYYLHDGLGSVTGIVSPEGKLLGIYDYAAFGEERTNTVKKIENRYRYTSREFVEGELYYYRARHMRPDLGRFMSVDPLGMVNGTNLLWYTISNPVMYKDSSGQAVTTTVIGGIWLLGEAAVWTTAFLGAAWAGWEFGKWWNENADNPSLPDTGTDAPTWPPGLPETETDDPTLPDKPWSPNWPIDPTITIETTCEPGGPMGPPPKPDDFPTCFQMCRTMMGRSLMSIPICLWMCKNAVF